VVSTNDPRNNAQLGKILSINISKSKGVAKTKISEATVVKDFGLEGDAHGGPGKRQISLLAIESINKQNSCSKVKMKYASLIPGDFAENITTEGLNLAQLNIGDHFIIGDSVVLELSKIGKECNRYCSIYYKTGDCIMPREGIFAAVLKGGKIAVGDEINVDVREIARRA